MGTESENLLACLSEKSRVLLLGGLAVIAHGLSRTTEDADVWLDSTVTIEEWLTVLHQCLPDRNGVYFWDLLRREQISKENLAVVLDELGVLRIGGMDRYVDIFRRPNELHEEDFEDAWISAKPHIGKIRLMDETFLIVTKENSERERDRIDIGFLETKLRDRYQSRLTECDVTEADELFRRYLDHATCEAALKNPDAAVREMGLAGLRELAEGGNPFAIAALRRLEL